MKSLAAMIAATSLFVAACVATPLSKPADTGPGAMQAPTTEVTSPSFEVNDGGAKQKHGKTALLPEEDRGKDYLKAYIQS
ncbi:MAG TPA: hypothetical protein VJ882_07060, partial [Desulfuromonadales bacterium]|nr:hypothetical protein [Desulfuromonadales bacterium]